MKGKVSLQKDQSLYKILPEYSYVGVVNSQNPRILLATFRKLGIFSWVPGKNISNFPITHMLDEEFKLLVAL